MPGISPGRSARSVRVVSGTVRVGDPLIRGQHLGGGQLPAHQGGVAGVLGPPLHPGVPGRRLPPLPRLVRGDLHHRAGDRGPQPARRQTARPAQHQRLGGAGLGGVQERGGVHDDLGLVPGDRPVPQRRPGAGQPGFEGLGAGEQPIGVAAGLPQRPGQLGGGELIPRRRHPRRAFRVAARLGMPPDPLAEKLHRDWRHISFARLLRTQALRTPGPLPRAAPSPPAAAGSAELALRHYRTARPPKRAGMRAPPRTRAAPAGPHRSTTADARNPSGLEHRP